MPTHQIKSQKGNAVLYILVAILLVVGIAGGGFYLYYSKAKAELVDISEKQAKDFTTVVESYKAIINLNKSGASVEDYGSKVLGAASDQEVLGLEDNESVKSARKEKELLRKTIETLKKIEKQNSQATKLAKKTMAKNVPVTETAQYVKGNVPILTYLSEMNQLTIEFVSAGVDVGMKLRDAIDRGADDESVLSYSESLKVFDELQKKALAVDVTEIPEDMRKDHEESFKSIAGELKTFYEVETALKEKDAKKLLLALNSMINSGAAQTELGTTSYISFWEDSETLSKARELQKSWDELAIELK